MVRRLVFVLCLLVFSNAAHAETSYERVMRTGVLRCGYLIWPPHFDKDLKTGKFSGLEYDYIEAIGKDLDLKIDWALEVTPGQQVEALKSGKIDAMCAADGPMYPVTQKFEAFSTPLVYIPVWLYVRKDDKRFDQNWHKIDDPAVSVSTIDGDVSGFVRALQFPKAKPVPLSQLSAPGQMMLDVVDNKSDIVINDDVSMLGYTRNNPDKLRKLAGLPPIAVLSVNIGVLRGGQGAELLDVLNQEISILRAYGKEEKILAPYFKAAPGGMVQANKPWEKK